MSKQWHYEQKGKSYIKVDTLHKIRTLESSLAAVTEQRDQYKAALQSADNHNHEIATKLETVTEQRDRLAEALRNLGNRILSVHPNRDISKELNEAAEVLQSLNQDHTVDANDMIAAVKGGADEIPR